MATRGRRARREYAGIPPIFRSIDAPAFQEIPPWHINDEQLVVKFNIGIDINFSELQRKAPNMVGLELMGHMFRIRFPNVNVMMYQNGTYHLMRAKSWSHA